MDFPLAVFEEGFAGAVEAAVRGDEAAQEILGAVFNG